MFIPITFIIAVTSTTPVTWPAAILAIVVAAVTGGGLGTVIVRRMDREAVDLDLFYPTWQNEMRRIHEELAGLRAQVHLLSEEVRRLGGDPLAVRYPPGTTSDLFPELKDVPEE